MTTTTRPLTFAETILGYLRTHPSDRYLVLSPDPTQNRILTADEIIEEMPYWSEAELEPRVDPARNARAVLTTSAVDVLMLGRGDEDFLAICPHVRKP